VVIYCDHMCPFLVTFKALANVFCFNLAILYNNSLNSADVPLSNKQTNKLVCFVRLQGRKTLLTTCFFHLIMHAPYL